MPSDSVKTLDWRWWLTICVVALLMRAAWGTMRFLRADDPTALEFHDEEPPYGFATTQ